MYSFFAFLRVTKRLYRFAFAQLQGNRFTLSLELLSNRIRFPDS